MTIPYIRGWIGLGVFVIGAVMLFIPQTRSYAGFPIGFGLGMAGSGFR